MQRINPEAPLTESQRNKRFYDNHKEAELERNRQYHQNNKEKVARRRRNTRHGITQEWFDSKVQEQDSHCAVCGKVFEQTPNIDHNHSCCPDLRSCEKCRRGLLCAACNVMIGMAKDSIEILSSGIEYLKGYQK